MSEQMILTIQSIAFVIVAGSAFGYAGYKFSILFKLMKKLNGKVPPLTRIPERIREGLIDVFGQRAVFRKKWIGVMHATIFWGFIIITVGTLEQFSTTLLGFLIPNANFEFIGHLPYQILVMVQDFFVGAIIVAVAAAFYRRLVIRPEGLGKSHDAMVVLSFTGGLMISILFMDAFLMLGDPHWYSEHMFFAYGFSKILGGILNLDTPAYHVLGIVFKWVHMLLVLGFACFIPSSKHLHIVTSAPNTFLKKLDREKGMTKINFEDESVTQYGAAKITDMSWKDTLDLYSCTECGRCQDLCPAYNTQKPLSPKALIVDLKSNLYRNKELILAGKAEEVTSVIDQNVTEDVIWACTSCRACEVACPVFIEHTDKIYDIRRNLVMMESKFPAEVQTVFKNMETNSSPWAFSPSDRANWAEGLNVKTMAEDASVDLLLWVGCAGSFDDRNKKVLRAFVSLLKKAGIRFAMLGTEEKCTGDAARRIGNEYLFQTLAQANVETMNRYQVKKIVTACPHCFNILKNEYKDFGGNYEVYHHSQFIARMLSEGKLKPTKGVDETITFHDSCYLGRWNNVYEQPREILKSLPSARLVEMKSHHDQSLCCGAGGGRMWMEETIGKRINVTRTEQAIATKAGIVAAACPFCMTMISDGVKTKEIQDKVKVMDIAELIDQSVV